MRGILAEVRGDWQFFAHCFRFPAHNLKAGICWKCDVAPATLRELTSQAPWRSNRLTHWDNMVRWHQQGVSSSTICGAPFLTCKCFQMDWLHAVDQGVAADFLGNLFWMCLPKLPGRSRKQQTQEMFMLTQDYYDRKQVDSRFSDLTTKLNFKSLKVGPKLRAKAAEARGLLDFGVELAEGLLSNNKPVEATAKLCARHLADCYSNLSSQNCDSEAMTCKLHPVSHLVH